MEVPLETPAEAQSIGIGPSNVGTVDSVMVISEPNDAGRSGNLFLIKQRFGYILFGQRIFSTFPVVWR